MHGLRNVSCEKHFTPNETKKQYKRINIMINFKKRESPC
jgi:hypothetical protein